MYSNNRDKSDYEPSNDETLNSDDYEKARSNYFMFNSMMEMGMQNYLNRNHVNSLVAFLNNKDNDENPSQVTTEHKEDDVIDNNVNEEEALVKGSKVHEEYISKIFEK